MQGLLYTFDLKLIMEVKNMIAEITNVWSEILTWITTSMSAVQNVFYDTDGNKLTFLGVLAIVGVAISICLLIFNKVKDFLSLS